MAREGFGKIVQKAREWWEAEFGLDWSTMETTFKKLTPELRENSKGWILVKGAG